MKRKIKGTLVVLAALFVICYMSIMNNLQQKADFIRKMEKLDEQYGSTVFSENAELLFAKAHETGQNKYLAPALMCIETCGGTNLQGDFNYWNIVEYVEIEKDPVFGTSRVQLRFKNYEIPDDAVEDFFAILNKYYDVNDTYLEFAQKWAPLPPQLDEEDEEDIQKGINSTEEYAEELQKRIEMISRL